MNRYPPDHYIRRCSTPHASGDEPYATKSADILALQLPTRVGMNREHISTNGKRVSTPHASGDEPTDYQRLMMDQINSPREWG